VRGGLWAGCERHGRGQPPWFDGCVGAVPAGRAGSGGGGGRGRAAAGLERAMKGHTSGEGGVLGRRVVLGRVGGLAVCGRPPCWFGGRVVEG